MKNKFDLILAIILVLILTIAVFIGNAVVKGILLLLFSGVLIFNTVSRLKGSPEDKFKRRFFFGILLFLEFVLALSAVIVIIMAALEA